MQGAFLTIFFPIADSSRVCCRVAELVQSAFDEGKGSSASNALSTDTLKKVKTRLHQDADPCSILE